MKISIITVTFNSGKTLENTILSVINQDYNNLEYLIIDGGSSDNTIDIINNYKGSIDFYISENDKGIYDAINKGINYSTGDVIGLLHSDDVLLNNSIISLVADSFNNNSQIHAVYGDIVFINKFNKIIRYYSSKNWNNEFFKYGMMPAHPSFYCKKKLFNEFGLYETKFKIASDFDLLVRFFYIHKVNSLYLNKVFVKMKVGGISTRGLKSIYVINREIYKICNLHKIKTNYFFIYLKYFKKVFQYFVYEKK